MTTPEGGKVTNAQADRVRRGQQPGVINVNAWGILGVRNPGYLLLALRPRPEETPESTEAR